MRDPVWRKTSCGYGGRAFWHEDVRFLAVASPSYLRQHPPLPRADDLAHHHAFASVYPAVNATAGVFRHGQSILLDVPER